MNDIRTVQARLDALAASADDIALALIEQLADVWVKEAQRVVPVDTGQLRARTTLVSVSGAGVKGVAELQADTPYAGFVEYGTRYQPPRPFFRKGRDEAKRVAESVGGKMGSQIARSLDSGGVWNPRSLI